MTKTTKTNHDTGWHKATKNPTTNYRMDSHKKFCKRCMAINGSCPDTGDIIPRPGCKL